MATKIGEVYVEIDGRNVKLSDALRRSERETRDSVRVMNRAWEDHARTVAGIGHKLTLGFTVPFTVFSTMSVNAAANLQKLNQRYETVFAGMTATTDRWVKDYSEKIRVSETTTKQLAVSMQDLLVPMEFTREEAFRLTQQAVNLAFALQKWTGRPIEEASNAITSGLLGITRPLQSFGVKIRDTEVEQHVLAMGLAATTDEITEQHKALAAIDLMYKRSADALRSFQDNPDALKDSIFQLKESWGDLQEVFGAPFLSPVQSLTVQLRELIEVLKKLPPEAHAAAAGIGTVGAAIPPVLAGVADLALITASWKFLPAGLTKMIGGAVTTLGPGALLAAGVGTSLFMGKAGIDRRFADLRAEMKAAVARQKALDEANASLDILGTGNQKIRPEDVPDFEKLPKETQDLIRSGMVRMAAPQDLSGVSAMAKEIEGEVRAKGFDPAQARLERELLRLMRIESAIAAGGPVLGDLQALEEERLDRSMEIEASGLPKPFQRRAMDAMNAEIERRKREVRDQAAEDEQQRIEEQARQEQALYREQMRISDQTHRERMRHLDEETRAQERLVDEIESQIEAMRTITDGAGFHDFLQTVLGAQQTAYRGTGVPDRMRVSPRFRSMDYSDRTLWSLPRIQAEERRFAARDYRWESPQEVLSRESRTLRTMERMKDQLERMHDLQDRRLNRLQ